MKRSGLFLVLIGAMLAALVLPAALSPVSTEAAINSVVWLDTAYKGYDPLLGDTVQAYVAGSTAVLKVSIQNTTGDDITIRGAKVKFDWTGGEYAAIAGNYPTALADDESGTATIIFAVPETSVASNQVKHSYIVFVDYEKATGPSSVGFQVSAHQVNTGNGSTKEFNLYANDVDPASVKVYLDGTLTTGFTYDCYGPGKIIFTSAPGAGVSITADYRSVEQLDDSDGTEKVFYLDHCPVVSGSQKVYVDCVLSTAYTLDYDTGKIKFTTAPAAGKDIIANYQYLEGWTSSGDDFAIYSADQNAAMGVKQQLAAIGAPGVATAGSREQMARAAMEEQLGDQRYAAGNLDEAKTHYDQAFTYMDKALKGDKDPNTFKVLEPTGALLLGIGMVLLAFGVILYAVKKPKGPGSA